MSIDKKILVNKIQCPDGTILESRHRYDYQEHTQEDGRVYSVEGGLSYQRILHSDKGFTDLTIYSDDTHELIRNNFVWGRNYDKNKNKLPVTEYILLKDLSDDHVETLCYFTVHGYPEQINKVFVDEHNYRIENKGKYDVL